MYNINICHFEYGPSEQVRGVGRESWLASRGRVILSIKLLRSGPTVDTQWGDFHGNILTLCPFWKVSFTCSSSDPLVILLPVLFFLADPWAPARNSVYFGLVSSSLFWITRYSVPSQGEEFFLPLTFRSPLSKAIALARSTDHGSLSHWLCNYTFRHAWNSMGCCGADQLYGFFSLNFHNETFKSHKYLVPHVQVFKDYQGLVEI